MTGWGLRRIQKVEMGRNEIFLKKEKERERKVEKVLRQSRRISLRYLLELLSKEWECVRTDTGCKFQKNITAT